MSSILEELGKQKDKSLSFFFALKNGLHKHESISIRGFSVTFLEQVQNILLDTKFNILFIFVNFLNSKHKKKKKDWESRINNDNLINLLMTDYDSHIFTKVLDFGGGIKKKR